MKSLDEINSLYKRFEHIFGLPVTGHDQKSAAWFTLKLGVISSSNISCVVAKKDSQTRYTYLCDLIAQVCTGVYPEVNAKAMDWGNEHEDQARANYEFMSDKTVTQLGFVFKDDSFREGCSPDGLISDISPVQIKCPFNSTNYIKFLLDDKIDSDWRWQAQEEMRVLDTDVYEFTEYDPRMKVKTFKTIKLERDEKMQATLADAVPQFIHDMDQALKQIGIEFGYQWTKK